MEIEKISENAFEQSDFLSAFGTPNSLESCSLIMFASLFSLLLSLVMCLKNTLKRTVCNPARPFTAFSSFLPPHTETFEGISTSA